MKVTERVYSLLARIFESPLRTHSGLAWSARRIVDCCFFISFSVRFECVAGHRARMPEHEELWIGGGVLLIQPLPFNTSICL